MLKKIFVIVLALFILMNFAYAVDSSDWKTAEVGGQTFKIPPKYDTNPYEIDSDIYWFDEESIYVFSIRYMEPNLMYLYGYEMDHGHSKKVKVAGHDAVHITGYDIFDKINFSILWFSSGEEFYTVQWEGHEITPSIKEVVKSSSKSDYSRKEFYSILNDEYQNYEIVKAIKHYR